MSQDQIKKEALFNEVKGSLFEYLLAKRLSQWAQREREFQSKLDANYLTVLSQQDRMVRQFYPEMLPFLLQASEASARALQEWCGETPENISLVGKLSNTPVASEWFEADLLLETSSGKCPWSLKLNKKNAYVNTKSGGIKSFFLQYFTFLPPEIQEAFNQLVNLEFHRVALELHRLHDLEFDGSFQGWVKAGLSELPGELSAEARQLLKAYYARIAREMHRILTEAATLDREAFARALAPLMGFGSREMHQLICFHDFKGNSPVDVRIHSFEDLKGSLGNFKIKEFGEVASVEVEIGKWSLQIRVKPMNKFTTTAIKINCSVREKTD